MSIFRESFPDFIQQELTRRQDGMASRNPTFLHQLNSRTAWVRMTSGVNTINSKGQITNELAKKYIMQGGVLNGDALRSGLGGNGTSSYDLLSPGGKTNRLGIRPMPGITNVSIQSKGAYGSLQEATVTFTAWDIRQLEELELLYMRPGYTVLLEFGWDYAKANGMFPRYDILDKSDITLNDAFAEIYQMIASSDGNYDALLGYVKNYNWSARDDGGYDCTTSIISLGEVLESLKCNWVPLATQAFDNSGKGLLEIPNNKSDSVLESYEKGIIPGLIQELWNNMSGKPNQQSTVITDSRTNNNYYLYKQNVGNDKNDRNGLPKHLGTETKEEIFITLGSFCDLLNTYVLPKGKTNQPLSEIVTYETTYNSSNYVVYQKENTTNSKESFFNPTKPSNAFAKTLKCIASPLSLSTNLGICFVRNDNWDNLQVTPPQDTTPVENPVTQINLDIANVVSQGLSASKRFSSKFIVSGTDELILTDNPGEAIKELLRNKTYYTYNSELEKDIKTFVDELLLSIKDITYVDGLPKITFNGGVSFIAKSSSTSSGGFNINFFDLFYPNSATPTEDVYDDLFVADTGGIFDTDFFAASEEARHPVKDSKLNSFTKNKVLGLINKYFTQVPLNNRLQQILNSQLPKLAQQISQAASRTSPQNALLFLAPSTSDSKQLGYISNIYVNLNFLYDQAISKNNASNDTQNKNTISVRDYLQSILREIQNSLGNVNSFDIQVDNRNAIGRIIDINFTGAPENNKPPFLLQIHNTNSVVRDYKFSSKIFPEMGSIIAISAQDANGIGQLGYDNATLVAWNKGLEDRLIPKKNFNTDIQLSNPGEVASFILPFLSKMYKYFQSINGIPLDDSGKDNINFAFGGLDFAFRDFLSNLDRFDPRNEFKTIIPTELSITLDGLGGLIIGNIFKINQDIVPRGYKSTGGRDMAYIVTKLGHKISNNDWVTELNAFPIVFENSKAVNVQSKWKNQQYPGTRITIGGRVFNVGGDNLLPGSYSTANDNNPFNIVANNNTLGYRGVTGYKIASNSGLPFLVFDTEANGVRAGVLNLSNYFTVRKLNTVKNIINTYAPPGSPGQTAEATNNYIKFVTDYLKTNWNRDVTSTTTLIFTGKSETNANNIKMFKTLVKGIIKQEGKLTPALSSAIDNFDTKNL
jgi:hypothetical protein